MLDVYVNYDASTKKVLGSYGEESYTPSPYIPITGDAWNAAYPYGIDNLTVSEDLTSLVIDSTVKTAKDAETNNITIKSQIKVLEDSQDRQLREIALGLDDGTAKTKLETTNTAIIALRAKLV
jgi:hypothetical protein